MNDKDAAVPAATRNRFQREHGPPVDRVVAKVRDQMDDWTLEFIRHSPFAVVATSDSQGRCSASPRGGEPGFIRTIDRRHLVLPDQPGNNLFQSFANLDQNPGMGLLFLIPAIDETARVNGRGRVLSMAEMRATLSPDVVAHLEGAGALQAVLMEVREAYYHCGRALRFSRLWDPERISMNSRQRPVPRRPPPVEVAR